MGRPGRAAASDLVPRARGAAHVQGRRRGDLPGALRVRFGEVEARGIALTPAGQGPLRRAGRAPWTVAWPTTRTLSRAEVAPQVWSEGLPATERDLCLAGLGFFTFVVDPNVAAGRPTPEQVAALERVRRRARPAGVLHPEPIVYEDFLPRSAAGIFASNLTDSGTMDADQGGAERDAGLDGGRHGTNRPRSRGALRARGVGLSPCGRTGSGSEDQRHDSIRRALEAAGRALTIKPGRACGPAA